jgi:MFS family permease
MEENFDNSYHPQSSSENKKGVAGLGNRFNIKQTFASLKHPNYKLWFSGQIVSLFGSWMQTTAQGFFIFELTHSPAFLGYVGFATGIPTWLLMVYAGVIADRYPRRTILIITQIAMMVLAFILALLTFTGVVQPWHIILLAFGLGVVNAFDAPARQAFVNELVDKEDLINAIALNATMFHSGAAIGPAIAGITYALVGPAWCFTINGISFLAVIYNLQKMKFEPQQKKISEKSFLKDLIDGLRYLKGQKIIIRIMLIISVSSLLGMSLATLFPAWAVKILHGDATTNGLLQTARGVGAVICSLIVAYSSKNMERGKILRYGMIAMPLLMLLFSFNRSFVLSCLILIGIGAAVIAINNLANGLIQTIVEEEFRGRVMAIYSFAFFATMPIGALFIGMLAEFFSSPIAIMINSLLMLIIYCAIIFLTPQIKAEK